MKPLILTGCPMQEFLKEGLADMAIDPAFFRFIWGPQPSPDQLGRYLGPRTDQQQGRHWSDWGGTGASAKTWSIGISAWQNFASNKKPSNCGST